MKKVNEEKQKSLSDVIKNIKQVIFVDDVNDYHIDDSNLDEEFDESDVYFYLNLPDDKLAELSKEEIQNITNLELLDRLAKIDKSKLSLNQLNLLRDKYKEKVTISKEDVEILLDKIEHSNNVKVEPYFKSNKFINKYNLSEKDCLAIIKQLDAEDCYANTRSININNFGNNLIIFEKDKIDLKDIELHDIIVYIKLDIDKSTNDTWVIVSIHDTDKKNSLPYKENLSSEELFWKMRDDVASDVRKKYNGKNIILDGTNIRPLTYDELNNKFAVSVEHADKNDFKTKEELEQIAKDINAEHIMFFPYEGKYGGEYSFLVDNRDTAKDIAIKYNQKAYAAFYEDEETKKKKEKNIDDLYHEQLVEDLLPTKNISTIPYKENLSMKKPIKVRESANCKNRRQLGKLIESLKKDNIKYRIQKSTNEDFRYTISYSRVLNEEKTVDNDASFKDFLDKAEVLIVDDAKTFDINQWEKENEEEINEELGEESNSLEKPESKFIKYKLEDDKLQQVLDKLKTSDFSMVDGRTSWKTRQFLKKMNLTLEDLKEVLRNLQFSDYKTNSKPIDTNEGYNEAIIFIKNAKIKELESIPLYIKLDYDSIEETPVIIISLHSDYKKKESLEEDKLEVKDIEKMAELKDGDKVVVDKDMEKVFDKADEMTKEFGLEEEPKLETFEEQMDFLAKDEQEAIDGYEKVIALVEDEHVKEQLEKILIEEKAHKDFLEKVKEDKELVYEEPLPVEEPEEELSEGYEDENNWILYRLHNNSTEVLCSNGEVEVLLPMSISDKAIKADINSNNKLKPVLMDGYEAEAKRIELQRKEAKKDPDYRGIWLCYYLGPVMPAGFTIVKDMEKREGLIKETKTPLKDLKISKYKYLLDIYDTEDNFIERKFFRSRPEADRFVDAMTDLYDIKISNNELVELENGKDFMGNYWKVIRNTNKEEPIKEELKESFGKDISDEEIKEIMSSYEYLDEVDLDDIVLECTDLHINRNKLDIDTYSEEWDNIWDKYNKRVYELAKDFKHEEEDEEINEELLKEYTTYWFGEREYPSKKVDHGEYDPHTGSFADGTTYDDLTSDDFDDEEDNYNDEESVKIKHMPYWKKHGEYVVCFPGGCARFNTEEEAKKYYKQCTNKEFKGEIEIDNIKPFGYKESMEELVEDKEDYDDVSWLKSLDEPEYNVDYKEEETSMQKKITANMFDDEDDYVPTEEDIKENMEFFDTIGKQEG